MRSGLKGVGAVLLLLVLYVLTAPLAWNITVTKSGGHWTANTPGMYKPFYFALTHAPAPIQNAYYWYWVRFDRYWPHWGRSSRARESRKFAFQHPIARVGRLDCDGLS